MGTWGNVLISHLHLVIPMSYQCHYTNVRPHLSNVRTPFCILLMLISILLFWEFNGDFDSRSKKNVAQHVPRSNYAKKHAVRGVSGGNEKYCSNHEKYSPNKQQKGIQTSPDLSRSCVEMFDSVK